MKMGLSNVPPNTQKLGGFVHALVVMLLFFSLCHLQQGDCVISKVLTFDLTSYPDANPNPND